MADETPKLPDHGLEPLAFSMSRPISDWEAYQVRALIEGKLAALFDQLKKDATPDELAGLRALSLGFAHAVDFDRALWLMLTSLTNPDQAFARDIATESRDIAEEVWHLTEALDGPHLRRKVAYGRVAESRGVNDSTVQKAFLHWLRPFRLMTAANLKVRPKNKP